MYFCNILAMLKTFETILLFHGNGWSLYERPPESEGNPKAPFPLAFTVGTTPTPSHAQLVPSDSGTHFTHHKWMES